MQPRRELLLTIAGSLLLTSATIADDPRGRPAPSPDLQSLSDDLPRIEQLISQLGSNRYIERRRAQMELRELGAAAFDPLHRASSDADPEIASAAAYLLADIPIAWSSPDDPRDVRRLLRDYGGQSPERRRTIILALGQLPRSDALGALCTIVRFDASDLLSRTAAVAVLRPRRPAAETEPVDAELISEKLGTSVRRAADWLRLYVEEQGDPTATLDTWQRYIDAETVLANQTPVSSLPEFDGLTAHSIVVDLMWHLLDLNRQLGRTDQAVELMSRIIEHDTSQFDLAAIELIDWFVEAEDWDALEQLLTNYREPLGQSRLPQYAAAIARERQGRTQEAERLALKALEVPPDEASRRYYDAQAFLVRRQQWDWAKREYERAIEALPIDSANGLIARKWFATLLYDLDEVGAAAKVLEEIETKADADGRFRKFYNATYQRLLRMSDQLPRLVSLKELTALRHWFQAREAHLQEDWESERTHLLESIKLDETNADVLIAMFRVPGGDEQWRDDVRRRIDQLSSEFQREIDRDPSEPQWYNQWAWLISNTEGDFQKAIRYSKKSLELTTTDSSRAVYLDTLGRCYYAAGDLENAVKHQREAVELDGSQKVMHRQLALFEKALAESNGE